MQDVNIGPAREPEELMDAWEMQMKGVSYTQVTHSLTHSLTGGDSRCMCHPEIVEGCSEADVLW